MPDPKAVPAASHRGENALPRSLSLISRLAGLALVSLLSGCSWELFTPKGDIGLQEKNLIIIASVLMLLVVIPVILLTLYFAWRYRESNTKARYAPDWSHSTAIEVVVWSIPCVIVLFLGALIWKTTHALDPYRPLDSKVAPVKVEVIALNWKWLFIYPDYGIASVNQLVVPVDTPIDFKLTAQSLMNSFFIPQLGSQVYTMAGMQTQLHLIANSSGTYLGQSSAYSGEGFSDMHFDVIAGDNAHFQRWIAQAKASPLKLGPADYTALAQPSLKHPVTLYGSVQPDLFLSVVNTYSHHHDAPANAGSMMAMPHMAHAAE